MGEPLPSIAVPTPPEATLGDRVNIEAYGRRVAKAAAQEVFRQFKPMQMQAKEVPKLRRQIASLLAEVGKLQPLVDAYKGQKDFFAKLLARLLGFEPDLTTQQGVGATVAAVKQVRRTLHGEEPANLSAKVRPEKPPRTRATRTSRPPRAPRHGDGRKP